MSKSLRWIALALTLACVGGSLIGRIVVRGPHYPGWDLVYPAEGLYLVSTKPPVEAITKSLTDIGPGRNRNVGDADLSAPLNSFVYSLIPGYLTRLWPWEYWAHTVTFVLVFAGMLLTVKAAGLGLADGWIVLLAWGASPPLLSFSLAGYPYASGFFPHAVALWLVLDRRFERKLTTMALLAVGTSLLSWYLYDTARTLFAVFLGAALLRWDARRSARAVWALVGGLQFWAAVKWPAVAGVFTPNLADVSVVKSAVVSTFEYLYVTRYLALPVLFTVGLLSFLVLRRDRLLVFLLLLAQLGLVLLIAAKADHWLRPRRFLMVDSYSIVAIALMYADVCRADASRLRRAFAGVLVLLLVAGNVWQVTGLVSFAREPQTEGGWPMPYTHSQADYQMVRYTAEWADELVSRVEAGEKLLVIYGLAGYGENGTNPGNLLERPYLRLGHERFIDSIFVVAENSCHRDCLPIWPMSTLDQVLDQFLPGGPIGPENAAVYYTQDLYGDYQHLTEPESATVFGAVRRRFSLILDAPPNDHAIGAIPLTMLRFRIQPRPADATEGFRFSPEASTVERAVLGANEQRPFEWKGPPFEHYWVVDKPLRGPYLDQKPWGRDPIVVRLHARLEVLRGGSFEIGLGSDETADVKLDGRTVLTNPAEGRFRMSRQVIELNPGTYAIEVFNVDREWTAHLVFDFYRSAERSSERDPSASLGP